jgi:hypothetical protein
MKFSPPPDLSSNRRLAIAALAVTLVVIVGLIWHSNNLIVTLGDTDDAMRLVFVRDLLSGRGWYDQLDIRLQPPTGVYMHWSRLLDGALAGVMRIFGLAMSPPAAEVATRFSWPLLWIFPAVFCALTIALRLGGSLAVFVCAVLLASNQQPFVEFVPGRIVPAGRLLRVPRLGWAWPSESKLCRSMHWLAPAMRCVARLIAATIYARPGTTQSRYS